MRNKTMSNFVNVSNEVSWNRLLAKKAAICHEPLPIGSVPSKREVTHLVVVAVAVGASAILFHMNQVHDLTENRFFGTHPSSLEPLVLQKDSKRSRNRSHRFY
jgi:hypothetical protein